MYILRWYHENTKDTCRSGLSIFSTIEDIFWKGQVMEEKQKDERLKRQIEFLETLDNLKRVWRRNYVMDNSRHENSAEHSWHIAVMAMFLVEYAPAGTDLLKVLKMLLIHDVIEIEAGDTFCYDEKANIGKEEREQEAADKVFGILPEDQAKEFRDLWDEFEEGSTPESKFANSMDRFQVLFQNMRTSGGTWKEHDVAKTSVLKRESVVRTGAPYLWNTVEETLDRAVLMGFLRDETQGL